MLEKWFMLAHLLSFQIQIFTREGDNDYIDQKTLPGTVSARYIRFHPISQEYWNNLRVEVYEGEFSIMNKLEFAVVYNVSIAWLLFTVSRSNGIWKCFLLREENRRTWHQIANVLHIFEDYIFHHALSKRLIASHNSTEETFVASSLLQSIN